jgi:hypothetical protein
MRMQVQAVVSAPSELVHQLSKQNLRRKDVYLMGVLWETASHICEDAKCQHVIDDYGNYVTRLEKRRDELLDALRNALPYINADVNDPHGPITKAVAAIGRSSI